MVSQIHIFKYEMTQNLNFKGWGAETTQGERLASATLIFPHKKYGEDMNCMQY